MDDDKPPFFKTWNQLYASVIGFLVVIILFFTFLTLFFNQ